MKNGFGLVEIIVFLTLLTAIGVGVWAYVLSDKTKTEISDTHVGDQVQDTLNTYEFNTSDVVPLDKSNIKMEYRGFTKQGYEVQYTEYSLGLDAQPQSTEALVSEFINLSQQNGWNFDNKNVNSCPPNSDTSCILFSSAVGRKDSRQIEVVSEYPSDYTVWIYSNNKNEDKYYELSAKTKGLMLVNNDLPNILGEGLREGQPISVIEYSYALDEQGLSDYMKKINTLGWSNDCLSSSSAGYTYMSCSNGAKRVVIEVNSGTNYIHAYTRILF